MIWVWVGFLLLVGVILALDLGVFNKQSHAPTLREALVFTAGTVVLAGLFAVAIRVGYDAHWLGLGAHVDAVDGVINDGRTAMLKFQRVNPLSGAGTRLGGWTARAKL